MPVPSSVVRDSSKDDERAIREICEIVSRITGIQLGPKQEGMVRSRLVKRLLELGISGYDEYHRFFLQHQKEETAFLVSLLTTHHTFFFREFNQFEFLLKGDLQRLAEGAKKRDGVLKVWSAACSRGQEVYTLAMFLDLHLPQIAPGVTYSILGTDVDEQSVAFAQNGVYPWESLKEVPHMYWHDHWVRGKGDISEFVKARDSLRKRCRFKTVNLLKVDEVTETFDLIFCRNVFIYFDGPTIASVTNQLLKRLDQRGLLFVGISETLAGLNVKAESLGLSIYRHGGVEKNQDRVAAKPAPASVSMIPIAPSAPAAQPARPIRVLCVDDSPSILRMMQEILSAEHGYEIVATAKNGIEAAERMKAGGIDVMTLDIHMPEMDGITYLKKHLKPGHPPVIMVTSVAREDQSLALEALAAGAMDFVEKPSLADLSAKGAELRTKLGAALRGRDTQRPSTNLDAQFARPQAKIDPATTAQVVLVQAAEVARLGSLFRDLSRAAPTLVFVTDDRDATKEAMDALGRMGLTTRRFEASQKALAADQLTVAHLAGDDMFARMLVSGRQIAMLVTGEKSSAVMQRMARWSPHYVILEDGTKTTCASAHDRMPVTSFAYMSARHLGGR